MADSDPKKLMLLLEDARPPRDSEDEARLASLESWLLKPEWCLDLEPRPALGERNSSQLLMSESE